MVVEVKVNGWNEMLTIPLVIYDDVFSVSGNCAHNLKSPYVNSSATNASTAAYNGWHNIGHCMEKDLVGFHEAKNSYRLSDVPIDYLRFFHVRDSSNRGPLIMRGDMFRKLGFFDEVI